MVELVVEVPEVAQTVEEAPALPSEPTVMPDVATTNEAGSAEPATPEPRETTTDSGTPTEPIVSDAIEQVPPEEPATKKPRKLKVQADLQPKKLSMIKAALQVLQDRKVAMTCPELIDVMVTEGL